MHKQTVKVAYLRPNCSQASIRMYARQYNAMSAVTLRSLVGRARTGIAKAENTPSRS